MAETKSTYEGKTRKYVVADDAHEYIKQHGGGKFLTEYFRAIMAHEAVNNNNQFKNNTTMLQNTIESLLSPSTWKENSPIYHHDYARTADMTCVGKALINYVFTGSSFGRDYGLADNKQDSDKMAEKIMANIKTKEDRMMVAQMLVDADNYMEFAPDYANLGQDEELEKLLAELREKYNGLDAHVEAAQLELAENLAEDYADVEDLIALFR